MAGTRYKDLKVAVSMDRGGVTKTLTYPIEAAKLPVELSIEGLRVTVDREKKNGQAKPVNPDRIASRGAMGKKSVEITLPSAMTADKPTWQKYDVFPIPREVRTFFPKYKEEFVLKSPRGVFVVAIASAHDSETDPYRGGYISKGVGKFFRAHSDLRPGDTLVFKKDGMVEVEGKKYPCYNVSVKT